MSISLTIDNDENIIKSGDYVIVQRQNYTKLFRMKSSNGLLQLGNFHIEMDTVLGEKYSTIFKMSNIPNMKKQYKLQAVESIKSLLKNYELKSNQNDNRHIKLDNSSQILTNEDINRMKNENISSEQIVDNLVNNSTTFASKTGYSQEKYLRKKEQKYFEYIRIIKPTIRLLATTFYRQDPTKTLGIRIDDLATIIMLANIQNVGTHLLYDSGTSGLVPAALMNAIGGNTDAKLIHIHPGNECQKNAFLAMNFPMEQRERCMNVNLYSVLRHYHQLNTDTSPPIKRVKIDGVVEDKRPHWWNENERACTLLKDGVESLVVIIKEHPVGVVKELATFLNPGRSLVVFHTLREPLEDLYVHLKGRGNFISLRLTNSFMRNYQVLNGRTHPEVTMGYGGFVLSGYKLNI